MKPMSIDAAAVLGARIGAELRAVGCQIDSYGRGLSQQQVTLTVHIISLPRKMPLPDG